METARRDGPGLHTVHHGGGIEKRSAFGKQTIDAAGDENSVIVDRKQASAFLALKEAVEAAITQGRSEAHPQAPDPIDRLRKLGELRDAGLLTPEEFEAKKADLLSRM